MVSEEAVSFKDTISACEVDEGKEAKFVCHVTGQPKVTWLVVILFSTSQKFSLQVSTV